MNKWIGFSFLGLLVVVGVAVFFFIMGDPADDVSVEDSAAMSNDAEIEDDGAEAAPIEVANRSDLPDVTPCMLSETRNEESDGLGFPLPDWYAPTIGTANVKILLVDFPNAPAEAAPTEILDEIDDWAEFFVANSYGRLTIEFDLIDNWYRMDEESWVYFEDGEGRSDLLMQNAIELADPDVDFSDADVVYIMGSDGINHDESFHETAEGISADGKLINNVIISSEDYFGDEDVHKIIAHELGHALGMIDLYDTEQDNNHLWVGEFDIMGNLWGAAPEFFAYHRWRLGWLDNDQVYCLDSAESTVRITPIEENGGLKAVVVPINDHQVIVIESRRALGYDEQIEEEGALVYAIDSDVYEADAGIIVYPDDSGDLKEQAPLSVGESVTVNGVTIELLEADEDGDVILVTR